MLRKLGHPALCVFHAREEDQLYETEKLAAELTSLSGNLNTGLDINHVLGKVFQALAQRKISAREATAFAYIIQLSLQSMPHVKNEIRWATNDAGAYHRMVRQTVPTIRDLPPRQPAPSSPPEFRVAHPSSGVVAPAVKVASGSGYAERSTDMPPTRVPDSSHRVGASLDSKKGESVTPTSSSAFTDVLSSTQSPAQAFLAARRATSSSAHSAAQSRSRASGAASLQSPPPSRPSSTTSSNPPAGQPQASVNPTVQPSATPLEPPSSAEPARSNVPPQNLDGFTSATIGNCKIPNARLRRS
jgi:hypothetical protein